MSAILYASFVLCVVTLVSCGLAFWFMRGWGEKKSVVMVVTAFTFWVLAVAAVALIVWSAVTECHC